VPPTRPTKLLAAGLSAVALAFTGAAALAVPATAQEVAPKPAASTKAFADSVGVNVHLNYLDTAYGNYPQVKAKLQALGTRWVRDGLCATCTVQHGRLNDLAAAGIRSQLQIGTPKYLSTVEQSVAAAEAKVPGAVGAFEGMNEWDLHGGSTWKDTLKAHQSLLYRRVKSSSTLSHVPVLGPSIVRSTSRQALGDISGMLDYGNIHPYAGGLKPGWNLAAELASGALNSGTKPIIAGEMGYHNAIDTTTTHPGVSEKAAGVYVPRMYLDAFSRGVPRTFAYELLNLRPDAAKNRDYNFGLLRNDFSEKPAYTALRTLMQLLGDTTQQGTLSGLRYELAGDMTDVRQLLLQGADGAYHLALWQDASVWDRDLKRDLTVAPRTVRLSFGQTIDRAEVFDVSRGTTAVSTHTSPRHLDLQVPAQPLVLRLTPGTAPFVAESGGTGLSATYFDNADLTAPKVTRVDPWIDFTWGSARPVPEVHYDTFSVRWTGALVPRHTETYTLHFTSDDGARVWIDGKLAIDKWVKQGATENTAQVALTAGRKHAIRIEYFDNMYGASAKLEWSSAGQPRQVVPASALYPAAP